MRAEQRVLHDLLRVEAVLQDALRVAEERCFEAVDQPLERPRFTPMDSQREVFRGFLDRESRGACPERREWTAGP